MYTGRAGEESYSSDWWIFLMDEKGKFERCFFFFIRYWIREIIRRRSKLEITYI